MSRRLELGYQRRISLFTLPAFPGYTRPDDGSHWANSGFHTPFPVSAPRPAVPLRRLLP